MKVMMLCLLVFVSCGAEIPTGTDGKDGDGCSVDANGLVSCGDGNSFQIINGTNGANGANGVDGTNGANGANGVDGTNGANGANGVDGTNGANGVDGTNSDELLAEIVGVHRQSVYRIRYYCNNILVSTGSAFKIDTRTIATNKHVIPGDTCSSGIVHISIDIPYGDIDALETTLWAIQYSLHGTKDAAKVVFDQDLPGPIIAIHTENYSYNVGDFVVTMGFPLALDHLVSLGGTVVSNYVDTEYAFMTSHDIEAGSSGSVIFNEDSKCIGIASAGYTVNSDNVLMGAALAVDCHILNEF